MSLAQPATLFPSRPPSRLDKRALIRSTSLRTLLIMSVAGATTIANGAARANSDDPQLKQLEAQILQIKRQNQEEIAGLEREVRQLRATQQARPAVVAAASPAPATPAAVSAAPAGQVVYTQPAASLTTQVSSGNSPSTPKLIESPTHQFGFASADGANTISIIARLQLDGADYTHVNPQGGLIKGAGPGSNAGGPLDSGFNARRARFGIGGTFQSDWAYRFIYDFGGSSDSVTTGVSGADTSGIENANITYNGFYKPSYRFPVAADVGYLDVPLYLEDATSSNDIMFLERATPEVIATEFGGGDYRSVIGARSNDSRYWVGAYLTGPQSGSPHTGADNSAQALVARASYQLIQNSFASLHLGADVDHLFQARSAYNSGTTGLKTNSSYLALSDRPELRVDPTTILNTGGIPTKDGTVYSAEAAGAFGPIYAQGEFFHYTIDQFDHGINPTDGDANLLAPTLNFNGGYAEASYSLGGTRRYIPATGAYSGVVPAENFSTHGGGWGALELAARYSDIDLDDGVKPGEAPHVTGGVEGGKQQGVDVGVNWYPNVNMKFMLDYINTNVDKLKATTNGSVPTTDAGARIQAIAARAQFTY